MQGICLKVFFLCGLDHSFDAATQEATCMADWGFADGEDAVGVFAPVFACTAGTSLTFVCAYISSCACTAQHDVTS